MSLAQTLVSQFGRMVERDGGALSLLSEDAETIRFGYRLGKAPDCEDGACVLPHLELQDLMTETAARREPGRRVIVELVK